MPLYQVEKINPVLEKIEEEIAERDHRDMTRDVAPLRQADDAVLVDSSDMTIEEVTSHILNIIHDRTGSGRMPVWPGL